MPNLSCIRLEKPHMLTSHKYTLKLVILGICFYICFLSLLKNIVKRKRVLNYKWEGKIFVCQIWVASDLKNHIC